MRVDEMFLPGPLLASILDHPDANNFRLIYNRMKDGEGAGEALPTRVREDLDIQGQKIDATMRRVGTQGVDRKDGMTLELNLRAGIDCDGKTGVIDEHLAIATYQQTDRVGVTAVIDITVPGQLPAALKQQAIGAKFGKIVEMPGVLQLYASYTIAEINDRPLLGCDPEIRFTLNDSQRRIQIRDVFLEYLKTR